MSQSQTPETRYQEQTGRLAQAVAAAGRPPGSVCLIAVSKRHPATAVRALAALGQKDFGESYLDEAIEKQVALDDLDLNWHFIGPIQSNKTRGIAEHFDWVHSVDRLRIARRLNDQRPATRGPLRIFVQVNVDAEPQKSGVAPEDLPALLADLATLDRLEVVGLMTIPRPDPDPAAAADAFARLRALRDAASTADRPLSMLSMGMSGDLEQAVASGATHVRVGTALFGPRD
ncbi:MAG: YggS family pyridoxal phosphate-dependent enzyme [Halothiobacillaceae bacterium]